MAINPENEYPGRIEPSSADYPYGAARDESIEGAEDGTPVQVNWFKDLQGFFQALLTRAEIVPSGDPDTVLASDYMDALTGNGTPIIPLDALAAGTSSIPAGGGKFLEAKAESSLAYYGVSGSSHESQLTDESLSVAAAGSGGVGGTKITTGGVLFNPEFGQPDPAIRAIRTALFPGNTMSWTVSSVVPFVYQSGNDVVLAGTSWDSGALTVISAALRFKRSGDSLPVVCPMQCLFKNSSGKIAIESAYILSGSDPDTGTEQQIIITYESMY